MMADTIKLSSPRIEVVMTDGANWSVQSLNADMMRWERYAIKNKLPVNPGGAPVNWLTYLAWSAAVRESMIDAAMGFPAFAEACASVEAPDVVAPASDAGELDPTQAVPDIG